MSDELRPGPETESGSQLNFNVIIIWKRHYVEVLKGELNSTSTYVPAQLTKDKLLVHNINTLTKINVKIDKCETAYILFVAEITQTSL